MNARVVSQESLSQHERAAMLELLQTYFEGVSAESFARDLGEKHWAILLEDASGRLRGFSTLCVYQSGATGVRVAYSGDTIVEPAAWGSSLLAKTFLTVIGETRPEYWLLLASGFRTYRFLPVFWREFWPRYDAPGRPALLHALARERFRHRYDERTGVVRLENFQVLRNGLQAIPGGRMTDPHVAFFLQANPGHDRGNELVSLCPLSAANQTPAGKRLVAL